MNSRDFKVSFGGDTVVGKSSIARRFVNNDFDETGESTIGAAYFNKKMDIDDKKISLSGKHSIIGRSVIVHDLKDDLGKGKDEESLKTGNAGARLNCAKIV